MESFFVCLVFVTVVSLQSAYAAFCVLPPYPENGRYIVNGGSTADPGDNYYFVTLTYSCAHNFKLDGNKERLCVQGVWSSEDPICKIETFLSKPSSNNTEGACILPPFPENGSYRVNGGSTANPGDNYHFVTLTYSCANNFKLDGNKERLCVQGLWSSEDPICKIETFLSKPSSNNTEGACILPPFPDNGNYRVNGVQEASPGQKFDYVALNYSCSRGYGGLGKRERLCVLGVWADESPKCVPFCKLVRDPSVTFVCKDNASSTRLRPCRDFEPNGTVAIPKCRAPYFFHHAIDKMIMRCNDGRWNHNAFCYPDCGRLPPGSGDPGSPFVVPWYAGIYKKINGLSIHHCDGVLIKADKVISSAQCIWNDKQNMAEPAENFAVALGKLHREWEVHPDEAETVQRFVVAHITVPPFYRGAASNYQEDEALLYLKENVVYTQEVRPACINIAYGFEARQLQSNRLGMITTFPTESPNKNDANETSAGLQVLYLPFVFQQDCLYQTDPSLISSDTFCAGFQNGPVLCRHNNGAGILFPDVVYGVVRYFIHGVASVRTTDGKNCSGSLNTFTQISRHEHFLQSSDKIIFDRIYKKI